MKVLLLTDNFNKLFCARFLIHSSSVHREMLRLSILRRIKQVFIMPDVRPIIEIILRMKGMRY